LFSKLEGQVPLGWLRCTGRREDEIKMDIETTGVKCVNGFTWFRAGFSGTLVYPVTALRVP
jgi:hypothetical protein